MKPPIDEKVLIAYADGELAGEQRRAVEQYLSSHPQARGVVEAHRRLTRAAQRAVRADTPPVPLQLRAAVNSILADAPVPSEATEAPSHAWPQPQTSAPASARSSRRWLPLAAAASIFLLIGAGAWLWLIESPASHLNDPGHRSSLEMPQSISSQGFDGTLSPMLVAELARVHLKCSRILDHFLSPEFGRSLAELPVPAEKHLGRPGGKFPDLTSLNYEFNGAGPCNLPGGRTLHLLYRDRSDPAQHVSLFLQPDDGQLNVETDVLHIAAGPDADHPTLVWRSGGLIYYITGDSFAPIDQTAGMITQRQ